MYCLIQYSYILTRLIITVRKAERVGSFIRYRKCSFLQTHPTVLVPSGSSSAMVVSSWLLNRSVSCGIYVIANVRVSDCICTDSRSTISLLINAIVIDYRRSSTASEYLATLEKVMLELSFYSDLLLKGTYMYAWPYTATILVFWRRGTCYTACNLPAQIALERYV